MPGLQKLRLFLDVNVWLALSAQAHAHHGPATQWLEALPDSSRLVFCRITQLSLLRLLTTSGAMKDEVLTRTQAWRVYTAWLGDERVEFQDEPQGLEPVLFKRTQGTVARPLQWADNYLAAFAQVAGLTLVTLDKKLAASSRGAILLPVRVS
jgi:toxin-antitoxin system PIN domain toxin